MPSYAFRISGIEPKRDAHWRKATEEERRAFWRVVVKLGLEVKDRELAAGLDRRGQLMTKIAESTRKHRHSAMGEADPNAPPLQPAHGLSRTRALLAGRAKIDHAEFFWRMDEHTGKPWSRTLEYHRRGAGNLPSRNVFGISPNGVAEIANRALQWWNAYKRGAEYPALAVKLPGPKPGESPTKAAPYKGRKGTERIEIKHFTHTTMHTTRPIEASGKPAPGDFVGPWSQRVSARRPPSSAGKPKPPPKPAAPPKPPAKKTPEAIAKPKPKRAKKAPAGKPEPTGAPVGKALDLQALRGRTSVEVWAAVRAIDRVHGDGKLPTIPIDHLRSSKNAGEFRHIPDERRPVMIAISPDSPHPALTAAHEIGHFIEYSGIPGAAVGAKRDWANDPHLADWFKVVQATQAVAKLRALAGKTKIEVARADGSRVAIDLGGGYVDYLLKPNELWARAYAQFVARRSESVALGGQLTDTQKSPVNQALPAHWSDADFAPVDRAMATLFARLGWMTK